MVSRWRTKVTEQRETPAVRLTKRLIGRPGVIIVCVWIVLAATTAIAQQSAGTVTASIRT
jgi:hypothetical protein